MKIRNKKLLTKSIAMAIFMSSTLYTMPITYAAFNNNTVPSNGTVVAGAIKGSNNNIIFDPTNITQTTQNAVIKWDDFSVGANATVNFNGPSTGFNTLNYVNGGNLSQIYGTINATNGNIYIVNPAGVQIGNSAQINVGSLYVSNKSMSDDKLKAFQSGAKVDTPYTIQGNRSNAELMSLGNINAANKVTFDGNRIVLDVDRVKNGQTPLGVNNITIKTTKKDFDNKDVVLGYTAYDDRDGYEYTNDKNNSRTQLAKLILDDNSTEYITKADGFMWVKDGEQLQAMNTNLGGNYAFRNSIDLNATADNQVTFNSVGLNSTDGKGFTGNLDGLGYEVYGLYINEPGEDTGLFAKTNGATIRNFNLISGSIISTENNAGAVVGNANNTVIENVKNTINVTGKDNVGGIIGTGTNVTLNGVVNAGAIKGNSNVGGLAGSLVGDNGKQSFLNGESYNLGDIKGKDSSSYNIGGLVGLASNSIIGNGENDKTDFQMYNHLDVTGGYNVGGIVGELKDSSTVQNVSNDGNIKAIGYTTGTYEYHTNNTSMNSSANMSTSAIKDDEKVNVANIGGIVGNSTGDTNTSDSTNTIKDVLNNGDISAKLDTTNASMPYYTAGNVGGVVGSADDTNISNATNKENDVRGAHNVGGIVGYFEDGTITKAINNGGDIMATGARNEDGFVTEFVRYDSGAGGNESFIVGNIGGIVGYMYGDSAYINTSANRGTVHTEDIVDEGNILDTSEAANVGGIVGKIDRSTTISMDNIKKPTNGQQNKYAISNSYNTGNVRGYTGVGGVAGMMYNGEIVGSYNIGEIRSTRKDTTSVSPLNMGGIVGDSTEETSAKISLYDVYNKGQIGDEEFVYKGRHVGGIAGRLSGDVEKSYNDGDIYNGANVTGGIAGWWVKGNIRNSFNTGNVTNYSTTYSANGSNVGGIAGGMGIYQGKTEIDHLTLENVYNLGTIRSIQGNGGAGSTLGGMIGILGGADSDGRIYINNVYTLGNLYADQDADFHSIIGKKYVSTKEKISNAYYITPGNENIFKDLSNDEGIKTFGHTATVEYINKNNKDSYTGLTFINQSNEKIDTSSSDFSNTWRIYEGSTTPILNAFLPETNGKFDGENSAVTNGSINKVQYGTAYDPLLTIINTNNDITLDWEKLGTYGDAGLAIYGGGLTLDNFKNSDKGVGLFGGIIYSDGALNINSSGDNIGLGSFSKVYGSSIAINADTGTVDAYGSIISTGNNNTKGDITITGANVNTYGEIKTAEKNQTTTIDGIGSTVDKKYNNKFKAEDVKNQNAKMPDVAEGYAHTVTAGNDDNLIGDIFISATNGDVNIYYGNMEKGIIDTQGDVELKGNNVYVDSDMVIGGDLTADTGENSVGEIVLDISNIGKVTNKNNAIDEMHKFLTSFSSNKFINFTGTNNAKITIDMWDYNTNTFDLDKYDLNGKTLSSKLDALNVTGNNNETGKDFVYIWVADGEQLKGIQNYANKDTNSKILSYNFALKNDINATDVKDYQAIGSGDTAFTGKFDGRGNRIIGLNVSNSNDNVGVFGVNAGTIKNLKVYSSTFKGYDNVGAIAGTNKGTIDNVTTLGNTVEALGSANSVVLDSKNVGAAGGVVGTNTGTVDNATSRDSVIAGKDKNSNGALTTAGGIAGINTGLVSNSQSHSAVIASGSKNNTYSLGGIVGVNTASGKGLDNVNAYGVTGSSILVDNTGGIAGLNSGTLNDAYNESIVKGSSNVGGIAGTNSGEISLIVNGASVTAEGNYTGGLVGSTTGKISDGRNNGVITGVNYVGGLVGSNGEKVKLTNLTNDSSAEITGEKYVGGIAGTNSGSISTTDTNLINRGSITGNKYVGGIAGENKGTIANVNNDIVLNATGSDAEYFGGVTGINTKDGIITNATNRGNINASEATYVGGITGQNDGTLSGAGNKGKVTGKDYVGGVAGLNTKDVIGNINSIIGIKNEGAVIAEAGGAGGIFGKNKANIQYAELSNSGTVTGKADTTGTLSGTGGIFGENTGIIKYSSLKNEVKGKVSGVNNVGGLIGINSGNIAGGRGDYNNQKNTYYKYQIYNNGTIKAENGSNIGGLIGYNKNGSLTAGYNTGNIVASGSKNVGGIVGTNEGTVDQVFNTIAGNGSVTGNTNVGGLIGTNSGELSNAYSTSTVEGNVVGNVVGDNTNNGIVTNIYATNISGNLIGTNKGTIDKSYSFSSSDNNKKGITYLEKDEQKDKGKYTSFDKNTWKFYDGSTNPLLKVFLTKAEFVPAKDNNGKNVKPYFVYNGNKQGVLIHYDEKNKIVEVLDAKNIVIGTIKVADENAAHSLKDYINTIGKDNQLINGVQFVDADEYEMLFSQQINTNGKNGNPNNLGFDFVTSLDNTNPNNDPPMITNDKAQINITLNDIERIYGNLNINSGNYGFTYGIANGQLTDEMEKELLNKLQLGTVDTTKDDGALIENGTKTNNANKDNENYYWTGTVTLDGSLLGNYEFTNNSNSIQVNNGKSTVKKADLVIDLNDVNHKYGTPNLNDYGINKDKISWVNGDNYNSDNFIVGNVNDEALIGKDKTQNANNEKNPNYK
ncbi:beta strand repeat-containing protein, partial [Megamonas funiformis]|uniref:beta strand repeat-containing protein n=1 Tax=Megamonas funiformis TaxID=437897 RepID=UPI001956CCBD